MQNAKQQSKPSLKFLCGLFSFLMGERSCFYYSFFVGKNPIRIYLPLSDRNQNENTAEAHFQGHSSE
jgi:hypothetical protein